MRVTALQRAEALLVRLAVRLVRGVGVVRASDAGGALLRMIGPRLPVSRVAHDNLRAAFPGMTPAERARVVRGVWDNLGRTVAELPHVAALRETASGPGLEIAGMEHAAALGGPVVLVSAHLANWEVLPRAAFLRQWPIALFYRAPRNPAVDAVLTGLRAGPGGAGAAFAKGAAGARAALLHLRSGGRLGLLVDQKMNDGIAARFFGRTAMTSQAAAAFALRFGCEVLPAHVVRLGPARFRVVIEPPLPRPAAGCDRHAAVAALTQTINDRVEAWVRAHPEQWLWLHRRWPNAAN